MTQNRGKFGQGLVIAEHVYISNYLRLAGQLFWVLFEKYDRGLLLPDAGVLK